MSIIRRALSGTRALTPNQAFVTGTTWNETKVNQDSALGIAGPPLR